MQFPDTIFALSSGRPPSGVAVMRVSGPGSRERRAAGRRSAGCRQARAADVATGARSDHRSRAGVVLCRHPRALPARTAPSSICMAVVQLFRRWRTLWRICRACGPAEAGEFTRRAFLNGKMDLVEAEALADLIAAETEAQRRFALAGAGGRPERALSGWRGGSACAGDDRGRAGFCRRGATCLAQSAAAVWETSAGCSRDASAHLAGFRRAEIIRDGYSVVIAGAPNAGKSSLLNGWRGATWRSSPTSRERPATPSRSAGSRTG